MGPWIQWNCSFGFHLLLLMIRLHKSTPYGHLAMLHLSEGVGNAARVAATYLYRDGILTVFPNFGLLELPLPLGPPNPQLKNVAEESLLDKVSRILIWICCY